MNELFILRHAKSSWDDPALEDHQRPLAPRGRRAVKLLATHLRSNQIEPVLVLCSSAVRTRETCKSVSPSGELRIEPELYEASADQVLERLRRIPAAVPSVMVVGHNPAMQMLVLKLADQPVATNDDWKIADVRRKFPTAALATFHFRCAWSELAPGCATLVDLVRPRDLH
jgi:phosphohistidine phosphatase